MKITKLGHCCMIIEEAGLRIMTDPGSYTIAEQEAIQNIDLIIITHEHADHLHVESLKKVLANNPNAKVITNKGVGAILDKENISYELLEHGQNKQIGEMLIEGFGEQHAPIYPNWKDVQNTGYFFNNSFFYPGDAFTNPDRPVEILALPIVAPWLTLANTIDYAKMLKPKTCFPVHDWNIKIPGATYLIPNHFLKSENIEFKVLEAGQEYEF